MNAVSAVLVTRGDQDLAPIVDTFTADLFAEVVVWNNNPLNSQAPELVARAEAAAHVPVAWANAGNQDLIVYGRYAAIRACRSPVIYVQDDDCVLPPASLAALIDAYEPGRLVCNMPAPFRAHYSDSGLVGFGAVFDDNLPAAAFDRVSQRLGRSLAMEQTDTSLASRFLRCCDVAFTVLTSMTWVDVPYKNLPYAIGPDRMYRQPEHGSERAWMLALARSVRDA